MDKREGLRAGIAEMRSVAQRLSQWADDLEASFRGEEAPPVKMDAGEPVPAPKEEGTADQAGAESAAAPKKKEAHATSIVATVHPDRSLVSVEEGADVISATGGRQCRSLPEVRTILAGKCAEGFGTQVKALIESYGAASLKEVPAEKYGELLEAVGRLGGDTDAG